MGVTDRGGGGSSGTRDVTLLCKTFTGLKSKQCLSYLLVSDKMTTDSDGYCDL